MHRDFPDLAFVLVLDLVLDGQPCIENEDEDDRFMVPMRGIAAFTGFPIPVQSRRDNDPIQARRCG